MPQAKSGNDKFHLGGADRRPSGVLPKNTLFWVVGFIAFVIVVMSFLSGKKAVDNKQSAKDVQRTSPSQLESFGKQLEAESRRLRLEEMARRRSGDVAKPEVGKVDRSAMHPKAGYGTARPEPYIPRPVAKAERATATSISFRIEEKASADRSSQVAFTLRPLKGREGPLAASSGIAGADRDDPSYEPPMALVGASTRKTGSGQYLRFKEKSQDGDLFRLFEGTTIEAVLENALDGAFTGPVLCRVKQSVLSIDKTTVLIPAGTQLLGEAKRVQDQNQTRLAVTFKRLIRPDGYSLDLETAPGLDSAGQTGLTGRVNNHYPRTFGLSGAIGLISGLSYLGLQGNPFAVGMGRSVGNSSTAALTRYLNAVPTITVKKGSLVMVYLPNDQLLPAYRQ